MSVVVVAKSPKKAGAQLCTPTGVKRTSTLRRKSSTPFRQNTSLLNTPQSTKKNAFNLQVGTFLNNIKLAHSSRKIIINRCTGHAIY